MWLALLGVAIPLACAGMHSAREPRRHQRTAPIEDAESVGFDECSDCHDDIQGHELSPRYHEDCEACHGPGSRHIDSEEPVDIRYPSSENCLKCHAQGRSTHLEWSGGEHERAQLLCSDCHNPHNREPNHLRRGELIRFGSLDVNSRLCVQCHPDVAARMNFPSHHPVREGMLSCTDCHAPHADRRIQLGATPQLCGDCHQDHEGPFIFEHGPVAEDCTVCHNPHGSASPNLLDTSQPALCVSCHTLARLHGTASGPDVDTYYRRCTDCHGAIHGSYIDPRLFE